MRKRMTKQMLAGLLALVMLLSLLPVTALAAAAGAKPESGAESPWLNLEDHYAYIVGYDDGLVHPEANITRAEVATIFFRMLTDEARSAYWSTENSFSDVTDDDWYNNAVSTLTNLGVIDGYPDGTFRPDGNITRAEVAAIAVRFFTNTGDCAWDADAFSDIAGHWANESINLAYLLGIVGGYPDGTYMPQNDITRAEVMTMVNNTLRRTPSAKGFEPVQKDMITWPDNMDTTKWYYAAVQEATNSHEYIYVTGVDGEIWTKELPVRDWTALEQKWADANSATGPDIPAEPDEPEKVGDNTAPDPQPGEGTENTGSTGNTNRPGWSDPGVWTDENVRYDEKTGASVDFGTASVADMTVAPVDTVESLEGKTYVAYDITPYNWDGTKYTGSAEVTLPLSEELKASNHLTGFVVETDGSITYIPGERSGDTYTFTMPHFSTGGVTVLADDTGTTTTLRYFPVTLFNYDKTTINNATHQVEVDNGLGDTWNGIYFSSGSPAAVAYSEEISIEDGTYIIQNARAAANNVGSWLVGNTSSITSTTNQNEATQWTIQKNSDGTYTLNSTNGYMTIGEGENGEKTAATASNIEIVGYTGDTYTGCVQLKSGSYYLCQWGSTTATGYGGYNVNNDGGNAFYLYKVTDSGTEQVTFTTTDSLPFAAWNWWNKGKDNSYGQYTYSGLVESKLDANKDIVFTKPEGGLFNDDATVKDIYTNVEMPFVYENGTYTFVSMENGAYFLEDDTQGSTEIQSNGRLYFNEDNPQSNGGSYGDGSTTVWMPFNNTQSINGEGNCDYHFGMEATIPFTMTSNGKMNPNDDTSEDITFSFSGDDDIWIFVDGQLVIDLGGIHNRLDATINFAENTWSLSSNNSVGTTTADINGAAISGTLFNEGNTAGTLNQTWETFTATDNHELTIFFLERGAGSSNCKIQFNLPAKDSVSVHKVVDKTDLTDQELAQVGNLNFNFVLYKKDAATGDFNPVANTTFSLLNANGQAISTPATGADGQFILQDGQTAKFTDVIDHVNGNTYYVVEDAADGFVAPTYTYTADAAGGITVTESTVDGTSMKITAVGSDDAEDHITFICTNTLDDEQPPQAYPNPDWIVVDYGLPVVINPLHNDGFKGDSIAVTGVHGAPTYDTDGTTITGYTSAPRFGTAALNADGTVTYQLTQQLSGVEVLTYEVKVTYTEEGQEKDKRAFGLIYIIPATSMYYEENFGNLVTFTGSWNSVGTAQTDPQETGYVRETNTYPYGSDPAYLYDSGDSNGTSMYVDTTNGAAQFSYTFSGTGTSFFVRTSATSGYIRVVITDSDGGTVLTRFIDTKYAATDETDFGTLYNIPVFTYDAEAYVTDYTVTVTVAKKSTVCGSEFWLDGIRVMNPLNLQDENASIAQTAYSADGEANMTVVTLRNKLLSADWGEGFVVFTDSNGTITSAEDYKSIGPKEEVYLNTNQSVTFSLYDWDADTNRIFLGIKAPTGSGAVSINGNARDIYNAADCYYDITNYADITTDEDGVKIATFEIKSTGGLISVTNIKVTGNADFTIIQEPAESAAPADTPEETGGANGEDSSVSEEV